MNQNGATGSPAGAIERVPSPNPRFSSRRSGHEVDEYTDSAHGAAAFGD